MAAAFRPFGEPDNSELSRPVVTNDFNNIADMVAALRAQFLQGVPPTADNANRAQQRAEIVAQQNGAQTSPLELLLDGANPPQQVATPGVVSSQAAPLDVGANPPSMAPGVAPLASARPSASGVPSGGILNDPASPAVQGEGGDDGFGMAELLMLTGGGVAGALALRQLLQRRAVDGGESVSAQIGARLPDGRAPIGQALPAPPDIDTLLGLPSPEERLMISGPEQRLALPAPDVPPRPTQRPFDDSVEPRNVFPTEQQGPRPGDNKPIGPAKPSDRIDGNTRINNRTNVSDNPTRAERPAAIRGAQGVIDANDRTEVDADAPARITFEDVRAVIPLDASGAPDVQTVQFIINTRFGKSTFNELSPEQRAQLLDIVQSPQWEQIRRQAAQGVSDAATKGRSTFQKGISQAVRRSR